MPSKKVLLVYPQTSANNAEPRAPLSVLTLCAPLEQAGYTPIVIDPRVEPDYREKILSHLGEALYVGFSAMTGNQIFYGLQIAKFVRDSRPDVPLVWGGIHPSLYPEQTLQHALVDIVARNEGEQTVVDLADCLSEDGELERVTGICFVDDSGETITTPARALQVMKDAPIPSWDRIHVERYFGIGVQTARGCPWRCRFCYNIEFNQRKWRTVRESRVLEELSLLRRRYGIDKVWLVDDNYFTNRHRVARLSRAMIEMNLKMQWATTSRAPDLVATTDAFMDLLKRSGLMFLFVGAESGSPRTLERIAKDQTVEDIRGMARQSLRQGIPIHTAFVVGFPGEDESDWRMTFDLMDEVRSINKDICIEDIFIFTPYPGNDLYQESLRLGFTPPDNFEDWGNFTLYDCNLPWLNKRQRRMLENLSLLTRFVFWNQELKQRYIRSPHLLPAYYALRLNAMLRWRSRILSHSPEWTQLRHIWRQRKLNSTHRSISLQGSLKTSSAMPY